MQQHQPEPRTQTLPCPFWKTTLAPVSDVWYNQNRIGSPSLLRLLRCSTTEGGFFCEAQPKLTKTAKKRSSDEARENGKKRTESEQREIQKTNFERTSRNAKKRRRFRQFVDSTPPPLFRLFLACSLIEQMCDFSLLPHCFDHFYCPLFIRCSTAVMMY